MILVEFSENRKRVLILHSLLWIYLDWRFWCVKQMLTSWAAFELDVSPHRVRTIPAALPFLTKECIQNDWLAHKVAQFHNLIAAHCSQYPLSWRATNIALWFDLIGTMQNSQNLVRSEVVETTFNLYSDAEKKASLSVCKIQVHSSLDMNGRAIPGWVYAYIVILHWLYPSNHCIHSF